MNRIKMVECICLQLLFVSFIILSGTVVAEEMLIKGEAKYIGWRTSKLKFTTCQQTDIEIGNGKIEKTSEKCEKAPDGPSPVVMVGTLDDVHVKDNTVRFKDEKGQSHDYYAGPKVQLKNLKKGDKVKVFSPIKGRAEIIEKMEFTVKPGIKVDSTVTPHGVQPKVEPEGTPKALTPKSN